jgi:hypothetical protein
MEMRFAHRWMSPFGADWCLWGGLFSIGLVCLPPGQRMSIFAKKK